MATGKECMKCRALATRAACCTNTKLRFRDPLLRIHNREGVVEKRQVSVTLRLDGNLLFPAWANVYTRTTELLFDQETHDRRSRGGIR